MEERKIGSIVNSIKFQKIFVLVLGIGIAYFYGRNVPSLHTVWELGDEAGYLWNAAYFTGTDWRSFAAVYSYYGYGYSVILTPLFWISSNGIQLIQGAYIINIICVLGMYFIIIKLLMEMENKRVSVFIPIAAFCACMTPYIASNTLKVFCEVFLSFWYCLILLLLYYLLKEQKMKYAILLGISNAFIFFIHTRAIIVIGALILILFLGSIREKREYVKLFIVFLFVTSVVFIPLYIIKQNIIDYKSIFKQLEVATAKDPNIINSDFILERMKWFNPSNYFACFLLKILYSVYSTGAIILPGFVCMAKQICVTFKKRKDMKRTDYAASIVKLYLMVTFVLMLIVCTMNGTGNNLRYAIYGRYYEYVLPVLLSFCFYFFIAGKLKEREIFMCVLLLVFIGIWACNWCTSYLTDQTILVDTNRSAAIAKATTIENDLRGVLWYILLSSVATLSCYAVIYKSKYGRWVIISLVVLILWGNTYICIDKIREIQDNQKGDTEIAEYLLENRDLNRIYMIDDNSYVYPYFYSRMQILLKDIPLDVINPSDRGVIENGAYILTYSATKLKESFPSDYKLIMNGRVFSLYQNEMKD